MKPKYPDIEVQLSGEDGNAFAIMGRVRRAMKDAGLSEVQIDEYANEATSSGYNHLIQVTMKYVTVL